MSDNNIPAANPAPEEAPGEFDFTMPPAENPRVRRRSLNPKPTGSLTPAGAIPPAARELEREAPPLSTNATKHNIEEDPAKKTSKPATAQPTFASTAKPSQPTSGSATTRPTPTSNHTTSQQGTRPATLYYSTAPRKDKEEPAPTPMKSTPAASPTPSTSAPVAASTRPAAAASSVRPTSVVDYRTNVERQAREQKSVGNLLAYLVYGLIALFVIGSGLAGYGLTVLSKQIAGQSVTISDLDKHYAQANLDLNAKLASTNDTLNQAQAQINRQQDLIVKQQETINRLLTAMEENAAAVRQERLARAEETASLRARLKDLEYRGPTTQKY